MFEAFWAAYPRRSGANPKHPARKLFEAFVKSGVDPKEIIAGAIVCANVDKAKIGTQFIPMASTWLRQRRWEDYAGHEPLEIDPAVQARTWNALLAAEKRTGTWPSKQIHKRDIPLWFVEKWADESGRAN